MSLYEIVFIARQDLSLEDVDNLTEKLLKTITDKGGKVVARQYWGLRTLSYPIKKNLRGHYVALNISSQYPGIAELRKLMGYDNDVIRSMIFAVEKHSKDSELYISETAKLSTTAKPQTKDEPSKLDLILQQLQFDS